MYDMYVYDMCVCVCMCVYVCVCNEYYVNTHTPFLSYTCIICTRMTCVYVCVCVCMCVYAMNIKHIHTLPVIFMWDMYMYDMCVCVCLICI